MYIVDVIPLSLLPPNTPQILSYFSNENLFKGSAVEVPLHGRKIAAIVVASSPLESQKITLKKTGFELKKIYRILSAESVVSDFQFQIALWLSRFYASPLGLSLKAVLPPFLLKKRYPFFPIQILSPEKTKEPKYAITSLDGSTAYIQKVLKGKKSGEQILIVVPEHILAKRIQERAAQNSEIYTSRLNNGQSYAIWQKTKEGLIDIIGTRQSLFLPFKNLAQIILLDPYHEFYKSEMSPKYNTGELALEIARRHGSDITFLSSFLSISAYHAIESGSMELINTRPESKPNISVIDMVHEIKNGNYSSLSRRVKEDIAQTIKEKGKVLLFTSRRGYLGMLVCHNCGDAVRCPRCHGVMRVHKSIDLSLTCHKCSFQQAFPKECGNCHSYKLKPSGRAGSQKIFNEITDLMNQNLIPKCPVLILDSDVVKNETEEDEIIESIAKRPSILIATQMIFSRLYDLRFKYIAIPNFDGLISRPDYETDEQLWYQIEKLVDFSPETIAIQTFRPDEVRLPQTREEYIRYYQEELKAREALLYPPFARFVSLSFKHKDFNRVSKELRFLSEKLRMAIIQLKLRERVQILERAQPIEQDAKTFKANLIMRTPRDSEIIREIIKFVPAKWIIDIDPRSIS